MHFFKAARSFFHYRYTTSTLAENYSGAAHYGNSDGSSDFDHVIKGIGLRSVLLILVSSLCLVLASIGVCICLRKSKIPDFPPLAVSQFDRKRKLIKQRQLNIDVRAKRKCVSWLSNQAEDPHSQTLILRITRISAKCLKNASIFLTEHPSHAPVGYGEIPKSCTIENRQNLIEHQLYATIQRKQPPVPPFTSDTPAARKGFDTMMTDRLKRLNNGDVAPPPMAVCPYSKNSFMPTTSSRCATLGRVKNLEMTEYQRQNYLNTAGVNIVRNINSKWPCFPISNFISLGLSGHCGERIHVVTRSQPQAQT